jgi:hypothetical protein
VVALGVAVALGEADGDADALGEALGDADALGEAEADAEGDTDGDALGLTVALGEGVGVEVGDSPSSVKLVFVLMSTQPEGQSLPPTISTCDSPFTYRLMTDW